MASTLAQPVTANQLAPTLASVSIYAFLRGMRLDLLGLLTRWSELGSVARFHALGTDSFLVTSPSGVQHVLQDNARNYIKEARSAKTLRLVLGEGLFLSEGESWRAQRKVAQPAFQYKHVAEMANAMADSIAAMVERWEPLAAHDTSFDLGSETIRLTLEVIGRALFGDDQLGKRRVSSSARRSTRLTTSSSR